MSSASSRGGGSATPPASASAATPCTARASSMSCGASTTTPTRDGPCSAVRSAGRRRRGARRGYRGRAGRPAPASSGARAPHAAAARRPPGTGASGPSAPRGRAGGCCPRATTPSGAGASSWAPRIRRRPRPARSGRPSRRRSRRTSCTAPTRPRPRRSRSRTSSRASSSARARTAVIRPPPYTGSWRDTVIRPHRVLTLASLALAALGAAPAAAIEYRLRVANVRDVAFTSFLERGEINDGATGPGLERLESSLDTGGFPRAVLLYDRHLQAASESTARDYRAVAVRADVKPGGEGKDRWDEVRWEGTPGEQSLWIIAPQGRRPGALYRVAIH